MTDEKKTKNDLLIELSNLKDRVEKLESQSDFEEKSEFEETRRCLMNNAHSRNQTHAGYIIAIIIGTLTLISRWDVFFSLPQEPVTPLVPIAFFSIIGTITVLTIYMSQRVLFWSTYHSSVLNMEINEAKKSFKIYKEKHQSEFPENPPCSSILNAAVAQHIEALRNNNDKTNQPKVSWVHKKIIGFSIMDQSELVPISIAVGSITELLLLCFYVVYTYLI